MQTFSVLMKEYQTIHNIHWIDFFQTPDFLLYCAEALRTTPSDIKLNQDFKRWQLDKAEDAYFIYGVKI